MLADAIARAVKAVDPALILVGLAGSASPPPHHGLRTREEVLPTAAIWPVARWCRAPAGGVNRRGRAGAGADADDGAAATGAQHQRRMVAVNAQTVCLHGDGAHALAFARTLRAAFATNQIAVTSA